MLPEDALVWLDAHPEVASVRAAVVDLNGVWRGKRLPVAQAGKILRDGARMPVSTTTVDIWGTDTADNPLVFETGDGDGFARSTGRGILPVDWLARPTAMIPLSMWLEDGSRSPVDPRQILAAVVERYQAAGLRAVSAVELEFYLTDPSEPRPVSPVSPVTKARLAGDSVLSIDELDHFEAFFADVYHACDAHGVAVDAAISENGAGQFEVNLMHGADPLKVADDAVFFKRFVKGIARKHGFAASFMAKPYLDRAGNGLHVHFSILDAAGANIFDNGGAEGTPAMRYAVRGLMDAMPECGLVFAPHLNSYRRLAPGSHAPTGICWGYENRTAAIRIPGGASKARRIEHRVAGADANPYLVLAAVLGAALDGIGARREPVEPLTGDAYAHDLEQLPRDWLHATENFADGNATRAIFPDLMREVFVLAKKQEQRGFAARMSDFEIATYLETV